MIEGIPDSDQVFFFIDNVFNSSNSKKQERIKRKLAGLKLPFLLQRFKAEYPQTFQFKKASPIQHADFSKQEGGWCVSCYQE